MSSACLRGMFVFLKSIFVVLWYVSDADQIPGNVWQSGSGGYRNNESFLVESYRNYCTETHGRDLDVHDGRGQKYGRRPRNARRHLENIQRIGKPVRFVEASGNDFEK